MLYVVQAINGPIKIGISQYIDGRLAALQTGNPDKLVLLGYVDVDDDFRLEMETHRKLCADRLVGEWFDNTTDVCSEVISLLQRERARLFIPPAKKREDKIYYQKNGQTVESSDPMDTKTIKNDRVGCSLPWGDDRFLRLTEVEEITGFKKSCIYKMIKDGIFPKQVFLSKRSVRWRVGDVRRWVTECIESRK